MIATPGSPNLNNQASCMNSGCHPGSAVLSWWSQTTKDDEGFGNLCELVDVLNFKTQIRGPAFLMNASRSEFREKYGFIVEFHRWKPNKIRVERSEKLGDEQS